LKGKGGLGRGAACGQQTRSSVFRREMGIGKGGGAQPGKKRNTMRGGDHLPHTLGGGKSCKRAREKIRGGHIHLLLRVFSEKNVVKLETPS